jgi:hypothetical protein
MSKRLAVLGLFLSAIACGSNERSTVQQAGEATPDTLVIDGASPGCSTCSIEVGAPLRLGTTTDREIPRRVPAMLRASRGTVYLTFHGWGDKPILAYDSTGRFIKSIGRRGSGPGEYNMTQEAFIGPGDSLFAWAPPALIVYAPDGAFGRTVRVIGPWPIGVSGDGTVSAVRLSQMYGGSERPYLFRLGPDATPRDSFALFSAPDGGRSTRRSSDGGPPLTRRTYYEVWPAVAPDGSVWTWLPHGYRLEHHSAAGIPHQLFGMKVPDQPTPIMTVAQAESIAAAFERGDRKVIAERAAKYWGAGKRGAPRPKMHLMVGSDSLLWVVRNVPAPSWDTIQVKGEKLSPDEAPEEVTIPRDVEDRLYHTIVEVIDPRRAQLIARAELPFLGIPAAPGYIGRVTADDDGFYVPTIYKLTLRR